MAGSGIGEIAVGIDLSLGTFSGFPPPAARSVPHCVGGEEGPSCDAIRAGYSGCQRLLVVLRRGKKCAVLYPGFGPMTHQECRKSQVLEIRCMH
jgi:hypothetical protein